MDRHPYAAPVQGDSGANRSKPANNNASTAGELDSTYIPILILLIITLALPHPAFAAACHYGGNLICKKTKRDTPAVKENPDYYRDSLVRCSLRVVCGAGGDHYLTANVTTKAAYKCYAHSYQRKPATANSRFLASAVVLVGIGATRTTPEQEVPYANWTCGFSLNARKGQYGAHGKGLGGAHGAHSTRNLLYKVLFIHKDGSGATLKKPLFSNVKQTNAARFRSSPARDDLPLELIHASAERNPTPIKHPVDPASRAAPE